MYLKQNDNGSIIFPYSLNELKKDHPSVSFPTPISSSVLAEYGVHSVTPLSRPNDPDNVRYYTVGAPYQDSNGTWVVAYNENLRPPLEAIETTKRKRNGLLVASDWTQMPDSPLSDEKKAEWATYRQALRDITADSDFPYSITWPTEP